MKVFDKPWIAPLSRGVVPSGYTRGGVRCSWVEGARGAGRVVVYEGNETAAVRKTGAQSRATRSFARKTDENSRKPSKTHENTGKPTPLRDFRTVSGNLHDFVTAKKRHNCAASTHTTGERTCEHPNNTRPPRVHSSVRPRPTGRDAPRADSEGYPFSTPQDLPLSPKKMRQAAAA